MRKDCNVVSLGNQEKREEMNKQEKKKATERKGDNN